MTMAMRTFYFLLLLVLTASTAAIATNESLATQAPVSGPSSSAAAKFLHASCGLLHEHVDSCYNLLLPYADSFNGSVARVARTSATIAIAHQKNLTDELARLKLRGTGAGRLPDMLLVDCSDTVAEDHDGANVTLGWLDDLVAGVKSRKDLEWEMFNAQTWFDTAGSDMGQCVDWINIAGEPATSSPVLKEVIAGCTTVAPYMEIAGGLTGSIKLG